MFLIIASSILLLFGVVLIVCFCVGNKHSSKVKLENYMEELEPRPHRKKVLIFQTGAYKDKEPIYADVTSRLNQMYCDKWNFEYKHYVVPPDLIPPYWIKTYQLHGLMARDYDYVCWLDLDAAFVNHDINLLNLLQYIDSEDSKQYSMYVSEDFAFPFFPPINAGVIIVKNDQKGKEIISKWHGDCFCGEGLCNDCARWTYSNAKWKCDGCSWARLGYEQHSLNELYPSYKEDICILKKEFFGRTGRVIRHYWGKTDKQRYVFFQRVLDRLSKSTQE